MAGESSPAIKFIFDKKHIIYGVYEAELLLYVTNSYRKRSVEFHPKRGLAHERERSRGGW